MAAVRPSTDRELEKEGYEKYVKENSEEDESEEEDEEEMNTHRDEDESGRRRNKAVNVYEYIAKEGGRVRLFQGPRGSRGRGGGRGGGDDRGRGRGNGGPGRGGSGEQNKRRDAPDLEDTRAFPSLRGAPNPSLG
eukprot:GHVQ01022253.1.p1 GENE.GHVQ01022253.1~~GHVQ01022253.1.p1  ORF type:complete len:135 (+),score=35.93 GHVQ01022253.1:351-755(+)